MRPTCERFAASTGCYTGRWMGGIFQRTGLHGRLSKKAFKASGFATAYWREGNRPTLVSAAMTIVFVRFGASGDITWVRARTGFLSVRCHRTTRSVSLHDKSLSAYRSGEMEMTKRDVCSAVKRL